MVFISKMVPNHEKGRFYAFGRVFSGTVSQDQTVRIMGPQYRPGSKRDLYVKNIKSVVVLMGVKEELVHDVPCGNIVCIDGIDKYLYKQGTITDHEGAHTIKMIKYSKLYQQFISHLIFYLS